MAARLLPNLIPVYQKWPPTGKPLYHEVFYNFQDNRGIIARHNGRAIITLFEGKSDASTVIHEASGHHMTVILFSPPFSSPGNTPKHKRQLPFQPFPKK